MVLAESLNGAELKQICEQALANNFQGRQAVTCHWYVTPCDCQYTDATGPRVCLPEDYNDSELASLVVQGLKERPEFLSQTAAFAANSILAEHYPCSP